MTIEEVGQEFGKFQLAFFKWKNEVNARLEKLEALEHAASEGFGELESRIKVLEEARQRQIAFNATVALKKDEKAVEKPAPISIKFWDIFKK